MEIQPQPTTDAPRTRTELLADTWRNIATLNRNGGMVVFNHFKARIVWIGIVDVRATETGLVDLLKSEEA